MPNVLVVNPTLPAKTVPELIALLKAEPDKYNYASSGVGTPLHLSGELFKSMAGVEMQHIPYRGSGPALNDVVAGQVPIMFDNLPSASEFIRAGTLRGLARDHEGARALLPRHADHRGSAARLRDLYLERPVRARSTPKADRRPAERRGRKAREGPGRRASA